MPSYYEITYNWIESTIRGNSDSLRKLNIKNVIGILRGGTVPAFVAAHEIDADLYFTTFARDTRRAGWYSERPPAGAKLLLVDDFAGEGITLDATKRFLEAEGHEVVTLTIGYDPKSIIVPDFSKNFGSTIGLLPWERHRLNQSFIKDLKARDYEDDSSYEIVGLDLDGLFLPDMPESRYGADLQACLTERDGLLPHPGNLLPQFRRESTVIITGRPEIDRERTVAWLNQHGLGDLPIYFRREEEFPHFESAQFKAKKCRELGVSRFYESDLLQATCMTSFAPLLDVYCWNNDLNLRIRLGPAQLLEGSARFARIGE